MKNKLTYLIAPVVICWCLFYLQGCKQPLIQDNKLLTTDDDLNLAKDTLHIKAFSEFEKPLVSNAPIVGLLGSLNDPNFGNTYASFYAQCLLTTNNVYFGVNPQLDSAVLMLQYNGLYGKFTQPVNVSVFELAEGMSDSTIYKTNQSFGVNLPPIGTLALVDTSKFSDSVVTQYGTLAPHLRIPLTATFGNKLLKADTSTVLIDNTAFVNYFKGLYITTSSQTIGNGLVYLNLQSPVSAIILYYHNSVTDSLPLTYLFPISGVTVNHFDNVYTGTPVSTSIATPNANGEEKIFIQAGAGVKGKLFIKDLDSLPKHIAINKAELILSQTNDTTYGTPLVLDLFRIDDAGQEQRLEDDGQLGYGGVRTLETVNGKSINRYRFNIKRYFQKLVQGIYSNKGFYLETISANSNSERTVISNSSLDKDYQITLVITYTKL